MMMRTLIRYIATVGVLLFPFVGTPVWAIDDETLANTALTSSNHRLGERVFGILDNEAPVLEKILGGANIKLKVFDAKDNTQTASLGFEYSYTKDLARHVFVSKGQRHDGLTMNFAADGNVAFNRETNPNDFLKTSLAVLYYRSSGGVLPSKIAPAILNRWEDETAEATTIAMLEKLPAWRQLSTEITSLLTDQYYFEFAGTGGLESDQSFIKKQYYYGVYANLIAKGWNAEQSSLAKFNIVDYPAAVIRLLSGADDKWRPRGSSFPEFLIGLDHVNPNDYTVRRSLGGGASGFDRVRVEASFRTLAATYKGSDAFIEANYRHYKELAPPVEVKAAGLDRHTYFTVALLMPEAKGLFLSYTTGKLPIDAKNDQVYEMGFKYNL